jgi:hypothetical protein
MGIKMSRAVEKYYGGEIYDDREIYDDDGETDGEKIATRVILDYFIKKELVPQLEVANCTYLRFSCACVMITLKKLTRLKK